MLQRISNELGEKKQKEKEKPRTDVNCFKEVPTYPDTYTQMHVTRNANEFLLKGSNADPGHVSQRWFYESSAV